MKYTFIILNYSVIITQDVFKYQMITIVNKILQNNDSEINSYLITINYIKYSLRLMT